MPKVFIVQNPVSGMQLPPGELVTRIIQYFFNKQGWEHHIHHTQEDDDIPTLVASAIEDGYDLFIAAGGDGTVSAVATGLAGHPIPMGILPVGTGNGMARDLLIPLRLDKALQLIADRPALKAVDAIEVDGRYHVLNLSVGITHKIAEKTSREKKRWLGRSAYVIEGFRSLVGLQPITFYLDIDGHQRRVRASEILVINSTSLGYPKRYFNLGINHCDGKLDLFIIKSRNIFHYLRVALNLVLGWSLTGLGVEHIYIEDRMIINTRRTYLVQSDGDLIGSTPVEVRVVPGAVEVIVPK